MKNLLKSKIFSKHTPSADGRSLLIVGIGNPGAKYQHNRHNIGFILLDAIAEYYSASGKKSKHGGLTAKAQIAETSCHLLWPQRYVNLSGLPVRDCLGFYKLPPENLLVIHDDLDLPPGTIKVKLGGGTGGHNGLKDIDRHIGKDYWRLRIGIGHPGHRDAVTSYVLSDFGKKEFQEIFPPLCESIAEHLPRLIEGGQIDAGDVKAFLQAVEPAR